MFAMSSSMKIALFARIRFICVNLVTKLRFSVHAAIANHFCLYFSATFCEYWRTMLIYRSNLYHKMEGAPEHTAAQKTKLAKDNKKRRRKILNCFQFFCHFANFDFQRRD